MSRRLRGIEIIAVGDELLSGATVDTNAARIATALEPLGLRVTRKATVGDSREAISGAVRDALERTGAVITSGGLGPTPDDLTKAAVAGVLGRELEFREDLWEALTERWKPMGKPPESNRTQAEVPRGAEVFPNPRGTAPGLAIESERGVVIMLPGPPGELEAVLEGSVLPYLAERAGSGVRAFRRELRTAGIAESALADRVGDGLADLPLEVAFLPETDGVDIRLTAWSEDEEAARRALEEGVGRLRDRVGRHIYGEGRVDLAEVVGDLLRRDGLWLAVAESCTGGLLGSRLVERSGASDFFWGGFIVYDNEAKVKLLGVSDSTLAEHGAVSEPVAREMAEGAQRVSGADCAISITGVAGPEGGTEEKPVGTVWLGVRVDGETTAKHRHYNGTRDMIRKRAAQGGLDLLRRSIEERER